MCRTIVRLRLGRDWKSFRAVSKLKIRRESAARCSRGHSLNSSRISWHRSVSPLPASRGTRANDSAKRLPELSHRGYDVVPVNPNTTELHGRPCFPRVQQSPSGPRRIRHDAGGCLALPGQRVARAVNCQEAMGLAGFAVPCVRLQVIQSCWLRPHRRMAASLAAPLT